MGILTQLDSGQDSNPDVKPLVSVGILTHFAQPVSLLKFVSNEPAGQVQEDIATP